MAEENERRVAGMTEEEREEERREIERMFGGGVGDVLRRARERREKGKAPGQLLFFFACVVSYI